MSYPKFDQSTDHSGKELYAFLQNVEAPEFVKQAELSDLDDLSGLEKTAFADESFKAYPINSKANVYLSHVHFVNKEAALKKEYGEGHAARIAQKIKVAADIFGITEELDSYNRQRKANVKTASSKEIGFVKIGSASLPTYSYKTASDLSKVASAFSADLSSFSFADRVSISQELLKAAQEENVDELPDLVAKYAGLGFPDRVSIENELLRRGGRLNKCASFPKIAQDIRDAKNNEELLKAAQVLNELEVEQGLYFNEKVARVLGDFVDHVFMTAEKVAEIMDGVIYIGKTAFDKDELKTIHADVYKQAFGMDIDPVKIADYKDELATMPASDVELFKQLSTKRAEEFGLDGDALLKQATQVQTDSKKFPWYHSDISAVLYNHKDGDGVGRVVMMAQGNDDPKLKEKAMKALAAYGEKHPEAHVGLEHGGVMGGEKALYFNNEKHRALIHKHFMAPDSKYHPDYQYVGIPSYLFNKK